jgi:hypothetical protein
MACFGGAQAVTVHQPQQHLIPLAVAASLSGGIDHPVGLGRRQIVTFGNMRTYAANPMLCHHRHPLEPPYSSVQTVTHAEDCIYVRMLPTLWQWPAMRRGAINWTRILRLPR